MKVAWLLPLFLGAALVRAAPPSCITNASDPDSFDACARQEILPLEARRVHAMAALRTKYRDAPEVVRMLERSDESWNDYRNTYCGAEAAARGGGSEVERRRAYAACARRTLEAHVKELESL